MDRFGASRKGQASANVDFAANDAFSAHIVGR
jgi:hypothetical protein